MNRQEKENLINSLGQKQGHKSLWARTRVIALIFNSIIAGFDRGVGSIAHRARTSEQRKVFKVRRQTIRKAQRDKVVAVSKAAIDEKVSMAKASVSGAVNSVKANVTDTTAAVKNNVSKTAATVKDTISAKTEAVKKTVTDKREASKAKAEEERKVAAAEKERKLAEKIARKQAEEERLAAERAIREEEERLAEEKRIEEARLAEEVRAARAAMLIEQARQEEIRREEEKKRQAEEAARKEIERLEEERRLAIEAERQRQEELARQRAGAERLRQEKEAERERIRCESAALFKANEEYKEAKRLESDIAIAERKNAFIKFFGTNSQKFKSAIKTKRASLAEKAKASEAAKVEKAKASEAAKVARLQAQKLYEEQLRLEKEIAEKIKIEAERAEAERLKAEADRLESERIAKEEAERARAAELEAERREIALKQQAEIERIKAERIAREEAERIEAEKREYIQLAIRTARKLEAEAYTAEKKREDKLVAEAITAAKQNERKEELKKAELARRNQQYIFIATTKAEEQRKIALAQNRKLIRLFKRNELKESIVSKYNNAKNFAITRTAEVKEHALSAKEAATQRAMDAKAAAAQKAATTKAIRLANSLAERARNEELANEKAEIKKEQERIAQAAVEKLRLEKERAAEALRLEREQREAEREEKLAAERAEKNAIETAIKLANNARNDAVELERQAFAKIKDDEKQQKVLERQVDAELKKLRKEADKFAVDEKKKEEAAARKQERDEANFARRKRSLRRAKKFEKSSTRLQRSAKTTFSKWSMYFLHIIICIVVSAITCFFVMWIQPASVMHSSGLWLLNYWPILITGAALAFLCQNAFISGAINLVLWSLLSMANTIKIEVRDDPVYPSDLLLIKEAATASSEYKIDIPTDDIGILVGCVIALLLCGIVYAIDNKGKIAVIRQMAGKLKCALVRFGGFIVCMVVLVAVVLGVYSSDELYKQFDLENYDHVSEVYSNLGFPFSFCHYAKAYSPQKPEGYDKDEAMFYGQNIKTETNDPKVHVIMIMDEAYSDLTDLGIMNFDEGNDPQFMFKQMAESKNGLSGHIVVPGFAGGTAYTEFDILTGMQTNMLADSNITAFRVLKDKEESLMSVLHGAGYTTQFEHVGKSWYYNRENAYKLLGADETLFEEDMKDIGYKGFYISDDYVAQLIEDRFNKAVYDNEWLFSYNVTIQNHMSYTADKYAGWTLDKIDVMATLTKDTHDAINAYTEGIRDANYMLYRLYNFFNDTDEPVMLVFFGDHMPYLGDGRKGYKELGIDNVYSENKAAALKLYQTPYLIWCNDAGAKALDFENAAKELNLPDDGVIQASYLGSVVLDLIGEGDISQWFSYLSEARQNIPVTKFVTEQNEYIDRLRKWTYYKITN